MEHVENGSHNSTRLSMYIRDMPLTPFGMSPTSERKKKKGRTLNNTPGSNKLSRKNVKQTSSPRYDTSNKENEETPIFRTKKYYTEDIKSSLPNITDQKGTRRESSRNSKSSKTSSTSAAQSNSSKTSTRSSKLQSKEIPAETSNTTSVCALSLQGNSESSHSTERRESVFTDIDDGSFIEFCNVQPKAPLYVPPKPPSSLYYSAESQNESEYSTSSKMSNVAVGFRKYVDAVKAKRALLDVVTEDVDEEPGSENKDKFLSDLSIVGGSADMVTKCVTKIKNDKGALNSTMIPTAKQPLNLPDISTLTLESEPSSKRHSNNSSPAVSPNYTKKQAETDNMETITISESSDEESFMTANKSPPHEDFETKNGDGLHHENHKNKNHLHIELEATCLSDMIQSDKQTPLSESLISEDVSIISSVAAAPQAKTKQFQSDATTVVYESVSVLMVPLRRSQRRSKEKDDTPVNVPESEDTTREFDAFRSKSPIYITEEHKPNITQRKTKKRNSKKVSESDNQSTSSDTNVCSSRANSKKISDSEDFSEVLRSPRSNTVHKGDAPNPTGSKQLVERGRRKKSRSDKESKVVSDTSEEQYSSKESLFVMKSGKKANSDHSYEKTTYQNQSLSNRSKCITNSDQESKSPLEKNKMVIEESDESSSDVPRKMVHTGKNIKNVINESDEIRTDALPVPKNTPNKYIWKMENNIPKKVLMSDGEKKPKSPQVKQWIVKSPFKEGSFSSNFLFESNTVTISDSPSQPNINKYNFKFKPSEISLKEKLDILDNKPISESMEKATQNVTPSQSVRAKISSPVENWVQTSPFKDSSLDSNFLLEEDNSYLSETPSQPKTCEEPDASSQSLKLRLSEGLDGSQNITASEKSKYTLGRIARSPKDASSQELEINSNNADQTMKKKRSSKTNLKIIDSDTNGDDSDHSVRIKTTRKSKTKVTVIDSETNGEDSDHSIRMRRTPGTKMRVEESDSESERTDNSSKKGKKDSSKNKVKQYKKPSKTEIKKKESRKGSKSAIGEAELKEIEKELNKIYSKDWHKNANAVLSSTKKPNKSNSDTKTKRSSRTAQKSYKEPETSDDSFIRDEADEASDEEFSVEEEEPQGSTLDSESEDETIRSKKSVRSRKSKIRDRVGSYISVEEEDRALDETEQDGLDNYLAKRKINRAESIEEKDEKNLDSYESSFINDSDEDNEDDSLFVLPTLPQKSDRKGKPPWGSVASILVSDEILNNESVVTNKSKKSIKNDKSSTNVKKEKKTTSEVKKGKKLWSQTKDPLTPLLNQKPDDKENSSTWRKTPITIISSDEEDDYELPEVDLKVVRPNASPFVPCWTPADYKAPSIKVPPKTDLPKRTKAIRPTAPGPGGATPTQSFLSSLSLNINHGRCHPDAQIYVKNYKKNKEALANKLYEYFNEKAFDGKLPVSMQIKWNVRMTKTAGFCYYQIDKSKPSGRGARIELSSKVLDKPDRLRDTLIHEMCHAAAWIISAYKDGHGPLWKAWAAKAMIQFPELPPISRCHSYEISFKYTYKCSKCGYSIGRHSKSLDTNKKVCGYCFGKFDVFLTSKINKGTASAENTPDSNTPGALKKTPGSSNPFILFVKENYKTVKQSSGPNLKHGDVMKILSAEFSKMKASQ